MLRNFSWPCSPKKKYFYAGTLNYSGIITSPYQFFQNEDENEKSIGQIFSEKVSEAYPDFKSENPQKFSWQMGTLDPRWKSRYAPINLWNCGVKQNNKMMNQAEFLQKWDQIKNKNIEDLTNNYYKVKYKPEQFENKRNLQIKMARQFDLFCYKTLIKIVYDIDNINQLNISAQQYLKFQKQAFDKPYLNEDKKIKNTIALILQSKVDLLFLQEGNKKLMQKLKQDAIISQKFYIRESSQQILQAILIKKSFTNSKMFDQENTEFINLYAKSLDISKDEALNRLNFNKSTIFQVCNNKILFSIHLTSKTDRNSIQIEEMKKQLAIIKNKFPRLKIICGCDLNGKIQHGFNVKIKDVDIPIYVYPDYSKEFTSNKKRTFMQPQRNKANILNRVTKDYIISDLKIGKSCIAEFKSGKMIKATEDSLLPTSSHPYDHYLVLVQLSLQN